MVVITFHQQQAAALDVPFYEIFAPQKVPLLKNDDIIEMMT